MTSVQFCFWLQGVFEIGDAYTLDARQTECIRRHLALVFKHEIDPSMPNPELDKIHAVPVVPATPQTPWTAPPSPSSHLLRC